MCSYITVDMPHTFYQIILLITQRGLVDRMMDYRVLFLFLILITTQTTSLHHHCNSDVYSSASGMPDSQQSISLPYCLIDNHTIMRSDTGQQLDIIYTTKSFLVVTPKDDQASVFISKNDPELLCSTSNTSSNIYVNAIGTIALIFLMLISGCIAVVHLMFKELCNTFGKLMIIYNIAIAFRCVAVMILLMTHYYIAVGSMPFCYLAYFSYVQSIMVNEGSATCMITYLAYIVHHSYKCREITKELNKKFYKFSMAYIFGSLLLIDIFILSYDIGTAMFQNVILQNGYCDFVVDSSKYKSTVTAYTYNTLNKIIQIILFTVYYVYYYKYKKLCKSFNNVVGTDEEQHRRFFKIAAAIGVTIGFSEFILIFYRLTQAIDSVAIIAAVSLIAQQCVIIILMASSKKIRMLFKKKFCTT